MTEHKAGEIVLTKNFYEYVFNPSNIPLPKGSPGAVGGPSHLKALDSLKASERQESGNHYLKLKIQPREYSWANKLPYDESNVVKYVSRHPYKGGKADLLKAIHCIELIIERDYGE